MANLARMGSHNPKVQRLAHEITGSFRQGLESSNTGIESLRSIFHYREENEEIVRTPEFMVQDWETLGYIEGDCDDIAVLVAALLRSLGAQVRLTAIQSTTPEEYDHVFTEVQTDDGWIPIDITVPVGTTYTSFAYMSELV